MKAQHPNGDSRPAIAARTILVGVDFSYCSRKAFRVARQILWSQHDGQMILIHVIDSSFVKRCIEMGLGSENAVKRDLFLRAKACLDSFVEEEGINGKRIKKLVCLGIPYMEINRKADEHNADLVVLGSCGKAGDTNEIFFGSTAERVLRFISRPVLFIPP